MLEFLIREAVISGIEASEGAARTERFDRLTKAAEGGDIKAQNELAAMYLTCFGSGVCQKDPVLARRWFERSAAQGSEDGMFGLALVYLQCTRSLLSGPQKCTSDYKNGIDWL